MKTLMRITMLLTALAWLASCAAPALPPPAPSPSLPSATPRPLSAAGSGGDCHFESSRVTRAPGPVRETQTAIARLPRRPLRPRPP